MYTICGFLGILIFRKYVDLHRPIYVIIYLFIRSGSLIHKTCENYIFIIVSPLLVAQIFFSILKSWRYPLDKFDFQTFILLLETLLYWNIFLSKFSCQFFTYNFSEALFVLFWKKILKLPRIFTYL